MGRLCFYVDSECNCHLRGDHFGRGAMGMRMGMGMSIACMSFVPRQRRGEGGVVVYILHIGGWLGGALRWAFAGRRAFLCAVHLATCRGCSARSKMAPTALN